EIKNQGSKAVTDLTVEIGKDGEYRLSGPEGPRSATFTNSIRLGSLRAGSAISLRYWAGSDSFLGPNVLVTFAEGQAVPVVYSRRVTGILAWLDRNNAIFWGLVPALIIGGILLLIAFWGRVRDRRSGLAPRAIDKGADATDKGVAWPPNTGVAQAIAE